MSLTLHSKNIYKKKFEKKYYKKALERETGTNAVGTCIILLYYDYDYDLCSVL